MSAVTPLANIASMEDGTVVACVRGSITDVFQSKPCRGRNGDSTFQVIKLADDTGDVKLLLFGQTEIQRQHKGYSVIIYAEEGQRGPTGMTVKAEEYKGNWSNVLKINERCTIEFEDAQSAPPPQRQAPPPQRQAPRPPPPQPQRQLPLPPPQQRQAPPPARQAAPPPQNGRPAAPSTPAMTYDGAKRQAMQAANLYSMAQTAAFLSLRGNSGVIGREVTPDELRAATSSVFIHMDKLGFVRVMPTSPPIVEYQDPEPPPPPAPAQPRSSVPMDQQLENAVLDQQSDPGNADADDDVPF